MKKKETKVAKNHGVAIMKMNVHVMSKCAPERSKKTFFFRVTSDHKIYLKYVKCQMHTNAT